MQTRVVNDGSVASPPTTWAPGKSPWPLRLTATTSWPWPRELSHQLLDERVPDLTGPEDDVAAHRAFLTEWERWSRTGRTAVSSVATTAPPEPKTVNWSSTEMPREVVTAQPMAQTPLR